MKYLLSGCLMFVLAGFANAQIDFSDEFDYSMSEPYRVVDGWIKAYFKKGEEVVSVKYNRGVFYFQKFSGDQLNEEVRHDVEKGKEGFTAEEMIEFNGRFYFFFSRWDRGAGKEQLFVREIDFENCNWAGEERLLFKIDGKVTGGFSIVSQGSGKFSFTKSFDDSRMIIQYRRKPTEKRDDLNKDVIGMHVYNGDLEEEWGSDVEMPYTEKKMNNVGYSIDGKGNAYILAEVYKDGTTRKKGKDGKPNYRLELIKIGAEDNVPSITEMELDNKYITDVGFFEGKDNQILVAGFYGNKRVEATDGLFAFRLNSEGELVDNVDYEIPVEIMKLYLSERAQNKMEKKDSKGSDLYMKNMVLREILFNEDGSITVFAEKYFYTRNYNSQTKQYTYTSFYQEVLVAKIEEDGSLGWMQKLPKNQVGTSSGGPRRGGMGYYVMSSAEYDYVLFLDNVKNIELPLTKYPKKHQDGQGGFLTGFKVSHADGSVEKFSILDTRDAKGIALYQFTTDRILKLSDTSFSLECYKKKKEDVMIKVNLKE